MFGGKGCASGSMEEKEAAFTGGWPLESERIPEGNIEVCGKKYKLVYRHCTFRENERALVLLAIFRDEFDEEFDSPKVVDEVGIKEGEPESEPEMPDKELLKKQEKKILKKPAARVLKKPGTKDLRGPAAVATAAKRANANCNKTIKTVLKRPSKWTVEPDVSEEENTCMDMTWTVLPAQQEWCVQKEKENIPPSP